MTENLGRRRFVTLILFAALFFGTVLVAAMALNATRVSAQTTHQEGTGENEGEDKDDRGEGPDVPITGSALEIASAAALDYLGEGRVTETEVGDEEGYYEIEITRDDGSHVDVHVDEAFNVLGLEND